LARLALGLSPALLCGAPSCSECTYGAVSALHDIARHSGHRAPPSAAPAPMPPWQHWCSPPLLLLGLVHNMVCTRHKTSATATRSPHRVKRKRMSCQGKRGTQRQNAKSLTTKTEGAREPRDACRMCRPTTDNRTPTGTRTRITRATTRQAWLEWEQGAGEKEVRRGQGEREK
jgi:hypothetical protein